MVQFAHPYMTTGKLIALTVWTFVSKEMSVLLSCLGLSSLFFQEEGVVVFFATLFFKSKDNCFTEFCGFLSNINKNQP